MDDGARGSPIFRRKWNCGTFVLCISKPIRREILMHTTGRQRNAVCSAMQFRPSKRRTPSSYAREPECQPTYRGTTLYASLGDRETKREITGLCTGDTISPKGISTEQSAGGLT